MDYTRPGNYAIIPSVYVASQFDARKAEVSILVLPSTVQLFVESYHSCNVSRIKVGLGLLSGLGLGLVLGLFLRLGLVSGL